MVHSTNNPDDSSIPPYLTLKQQHCDEFRQRAIAKFKQDAYLTGLYNELKGGRDYSISKDTITRILKGSRGRARNVIALCDYFEVDFEEACIETELAFQEPPISNQSDITQLIQALRSRIKFSFETSENGFSRDHESQWIQKNFIELNLVEVEFLPSEYPISDPNRLLIDSQSREDQFDRMGIRLLRGRKTNARQVLQDHHSFFVYGEPGSGKTSYLQWIAFKCRDGELLQTFVPIFIDIRHLATTIRVEALLTSIEKMFARWNISTSNMMRILASGAGLFIFDGLDETPASAREVIEVMIQRLIQDYEHCRFIFSSRLTSNFPIFSRFQKVITAPLQSKKQIPQFIECWFNQPGKNPEMSTLMLDKLRSQKYQAIRELSRRPVLLKLLCIVFEFEEDFPKKRFDVFSTGISKMSGLTRDIETHIPGASKLHEHQIQYILCRVASYFFIDLKCQILFSTRDVERIIEDYFFEVYEINRDKIPGHIILEGIEKSTGLLVRWAQNFCAFSHLTYQEFFTSVYLVRNQKQTDVYQYLDDPRWHFVIGLVSEQLSPELSKDFFDGFKHSIDEHVNRDSKLVEYLETLNRAAAFSSYSVTLESAYVQTYIRAWYFAYSLKDKGKITNIGTIKSSTGKSSENFDLPELEFATSTITSQMLEGHELIYKAYHCLSKESYSGDFQSLLKKLKSFLSNDPQKIDVLDGWLQLLNEDKAKFETTAEWWSAKHNSWLKRFTRLMVSLGLPCTAGLSNAQLAKLRSYYNLTKLLSTCMNRSQLSVNQRHQLADSMLLLTTLPPDDFVGFGT